MTLSDESLDPRAAERLAWARVATGDARLQLQRASTDAGFRSYWRGESSAGSCIIMDSPPLLEDVRPWLRMHGLLQAAGVRVPKVRAQDAEAGFLLLEDLGTQTYLQLVDAGNADTLFDAAITELLKIQAIALPARFPAYDESLLLAELRLFDEWFLGRHLGVQLDASETEQLNEVYRRLIDAARAQPQVLVHRDFMPRNLMPAGDAAAVLDFQDAVRGPLAYDVLSLFKDAFLSWPEAQVTAWLEHYRQRAAAAGLPVPAAAAFRRDADWIGMHRHLKVMGIFARLNYRDHKPKYLADAPRFLAYLDSVVPLHPQLAALDALLERHVRPQLGVVSC